MLGPVVVPACNLVSVKWMESLCSNFYSTNKVRGCSIGVWEGGSGQFIELVGVVTDFEF